MRAPTCWGVEPAVRVTVASAPRPPSRSRLSTASATSSRIALAYPEQGHSRSCSRLLLGVSQRLEPVLGRLVHGQVYLARLQRTGLGLLLGVLELRQAMLQRAGRLTRHVLLLARVRLHAVQLLGSQAARIAGVRQDQLQRRAVLAQAQRLQHVALVALLGEG